MVKTSVRKRLARGDIIKVSFDPIVGHEQAGYRPALVLSDTLFHEKTGFAFCLPITSKQKGLLFEIEITGDNISGVALLHGARMLDLSARKYVVVDKAQPNALQKAQIILQKIIVE